MNRRLRQCWARQPNCLQGAARSLVRGLFKLEPPVKAIEAPLQTCVVRGTLECSEANVERGLQGLRTPRVAARQGRRAEGRLQCAAGHRNAPLHLSQRLRAAARAWRARKR